MGHFLSFIFIVVISCQISRSDILDCENDDQCKEGANCVDNSCIVVEYNKIEGLKCEWGYGDHEYLMSTIESLEIAKEKCTRDNYCDGINDYGCDGKHLMMCSKGTSLRNSSHGGCVFDKKVYGWQKESFDQLVKDGGNTIKVVENITPEKCKQICDETKDCNNIKFCKASKIESRYRNLVSQHCVLQDKLLIGNEWAFYRPITYCNTWYRNDNYKLSSK